jgi:hypothetical protein
VSSDRLLQTRLKDDIETRSEAQAERPGLLFDKLVRHFFKPNVSVIFFTLVGVPQRFLRALASDQVKTSQTFWRVYRPKTASAAIIEQLMKGLILAQNERWRRGLGMQVEREFPLRGNSSVA